MTPARPLTPLEVDTLRVALALLLHEDRGPHLTDARIETEVTTIASDEQIAQLLRELDHADVDVRRASR